MKVKTFKSTDLDKLENSIQEYLKLYVDFENVSISHSSVYKPIEIKGGVPIGGYILYTAILIYK